MTSFMIASFAFRALNILGINSTAVPRKRGPFSQVKRLGKTVTKRLIMISEALYQRRIRNGENQSSACDGLLKTRS